MAGEPLARGQSQPKGGPALTRRDMELEFWRTGRIAPRAPKPTAPPRVDPSRLGIVIADVTDKGVPAALFMVLSRTVIRATASDGRSPAMVLEQANRLILAEIQIRPVRDLLLLHPRSRQRRADLRQRRP